MLCNEIIWPQQQHRHMLKAKAAELYGEAFVGAIGVVEGTDFDIPHPKILKQPASVVQQEKKTCSKGNCNS